MKSIRAFALKRPLTVFLCTVLPLSWIILSSLFLNGLPIEIGLLIVNYFGLLGMSVLITYWLHGRKGVKKLFSGVTMWRVGIGYYLIALLAIPALTLLLAMTFWHVHILQNAWGGMVSSYLVSLLSGALIINLWEETAWSGFFQNTLMRRKGILKGSLLTAPAFVGIHLPLLLQQHGVTDLAISFLALAGLALFFRYLLGMIFADTGGSILLAGLTHASFNSSGSLGGETQIASIFATMLLTLFIAGYRKWRNKSDNLKLPQNDLLLKKS
jgi:membrane protease YdiL (CAAX protease family)